jgi:hypothetical protein
VTLFAECRLTHRSARTGATSSPLHFQTSSRSSTTLIDSSSELKSATTLPAPIVVDEKRYALSFSVTEETYSRLAEVQELLSSRTGSKPKIEEVFNTVLARFIEQNSPRERLKRRRARRTKRLRKMEAQAVKPDNSEIAVLTVELIEEAPAPCPNKSVHAEATRTSRRISTELKDLVLERDGYRCAYKSAEGKRCGSTVDLEIDHVVPFGSGGGNNISNLRTVCRAHNSFLAEQFYGAEFMQSRVNRSAFSRKSNSGADAMEMGGAIVKFEGDEFGAAERADGVEILEPEKTDL